MGAPVETRVPMAVMIAFNFSRWSTDGIFKCCDETGHANLTAKVDEQQSPGSLLTCSVIALCQGQMCLCVSVELGKSVLAY